MVRFSFVIVKFVFVVAVTVMSSVRFPPDMLTFHAVSLPPTVQEQVRLPGATLLIVKPVTAAQAAFGLPSG